MSTQENPRMGYTCAYTPLALLDAAGFTPLRLLPMSQSPDQAGALLHDNLCPHVKRVLDRAMDNDLPPLAGVIFMDSCDAMRRLADAWLEARPQDRQVLVDLPVSPTEESAAYLAGELRRLAALLSGWAGRPLAEEDVIRAAQDRDGLARALERLDRLAAQGKLPGGRGELQRLYNLSVTSPVTQALEEIEALDTEAGEPTTSAVPLFLLGNVMPDPAAFQLLEECGVRVAGDDLCTGARQQTPMALDGADVFLGMARGLLNRPACGRTIDPARPDMLMRQILEAATASKARGVIVHVVKFCDPYLARLPVIRIGLEQAGLPLLLLEGDCTLRSLGQHRTRIEAFVEMLAC